MTKKIFISGNFLSGKQTILYLLDNHDCIISNFIHDQFIKSLIDINNKIENKKYLKTKSNIQVIEVFNFRNNKASINYENFKDSFDLSNINHLKELAQSRIMPNNFSSLKKEFFKFNFNYENFLIDLKEKIFLSDQKKYSLEDIYDIYVVCFIKNWKDLNLHSKEKNKINFAAKLPNDFLSVEFVSKQKFNSKVIYVDRDLLSILKSRALNIMTQNKIEIIHFNKYFNNQLRTNFLERVSLNKREILKLKKIYNNIFITSLEKLTKNTKDELEKIYSFLELSNPNTKKIMPTYCGNEIGSDHIDQINDNKYEVSNKNYIFYQFRTSKFLDALFLLFKNINCFDLFLLSIYLKLKHKIN
jgi:hypothetical protein